MATEIKLNLSGHQNDTLNELGYVFPGTIQISPDIMYSTNLEKVVEFLKKQGIKSGDVVHIALPGMSMLTSMAIIAIHGLTGQFPFVIPLVRTESGRFEAGIPADLQNLRNTIARGNRNNIIEL
jgi:hypothetical protein